MASRLSLLSTRGARSAVLERRDKAAPQDREAAQEQDLGSPGVLIPARGNLIEGRKDDILYNLNEDNLGKNIPTSTSRWSRRRRSWHLLDRAGPRNRNDGRVRSSGIALPRFIESDVYNANAIAGIICGTDASRSALSISFGTYRGEQIGRIRPRASADQSSGADPQHQRDRCGDCGDAQTRSERCRAYSPRRMAAGHRARCRDHVVTRPWQHGCRLEKPSSGLGRPPLLLAPQVDAKNIIRPERNPASRVMYLR
jgi:hypothetical protein